MDGDSADMTTDDSVKASPLNSTKPGDGNETSATHQLEDFVKFAKEVYTERLLVIRDQGYRLNTGLTD